MAKNQPMAVCLFLNKIKIGESQGIYFTISTQFAKVLKLCKLHSLMQKKPLNEDYEIDINPISEMPFRKQHNHTFDTF